LFVFQGCNTLQAIDKWIFDRDELAMLRLSPDEWKTIRLLTGMLDVSLIHGLIVAYFICCIPDLYPCDKDNVPSWHPQSTMGNTTVRGHEEISGRQF
jgi:hypothetical protein